MSTICVADFLTAEVWTMSGLVRYQVLFFMNLAKRHVQIAQISCQMNEEVMAQLARNLTDSEDGFLQGMEYFVCDHDPLFTNEFESILDSSDVRLLRTRVATPQQNGFAERFVKSIKEECLNRLVWTQGFCRRSAPRNFGEKSLKCAVNEYVEHYHHESPRSAALATNHQGLDNLIPFPYVAQAKGQSGSVVKFERRTVPRAFGRADSLTTIIGSMKAQSKKER